MDLLISLAFCITAFFLLSTVSLLFCSCWKRQRLNAQNQTHSEKCEYSEINPHSLPYMFMPSSLRNTMGKDKHPASNGMAKLSNSADNMDLAYATTYGLYNNLQTAELTSPNLLKKGGNLHRNCELPPVPLCTDHTQVTELHNHDKLQPNSVSINDEGNNYYSVPSVNKSGTKLPLELDIDYSLCTDHATVCPLINGENDTGDLASDSDGLYASVNQSMNKHENQTDNGTHSPKNVTSGVLFAKSPGCDRPELIHTTDYYSHITDHCDDDSLSARNEESVLSTISTNQTALHVIKSSDKSTSSWCQPSHLYAQLESHPTNDAVLFHECLNSPAPIHTTSTSMYSGPPIPERGYDQSEIDIVNHIRSFQNNPPIPNVVQDCAYIRMRPSCSVWKSKLVSKIIAPHVKEQRNNHQQRRQQSTHSIPIGAFEPTAPSGTLIQDNSEYEPIDNYSDQPQEFTICSPTINHNNNNIDHVAASSSLPSSPPSSNKTNRHSMNNTSTNNPHSQTSCNQTDDEDSDRVRKLSKQSYAEILEHDAYTLLNSILSNDQIVDSPYSPDKGVPIDGVRILAEMNEFRHMDSELDLTQWRAPVTKTANASTNTSVDRTRAICHIDKKISANSYE